VGSRLGGVGIYAPGRCHLVCATHAHRCLVPFDHHTMLLYRDDW
jgi:hypothetical protein